MMLMLCRQDLGKQLNLYFVSFVQELKLVCGSDGKTYANSCRAACADIHDTSPGRCQIEAKLWPKQPCVCTKVTP